MAQRVIDLAKTSSATAIDKDAHVFQVELDEVLKWVNESGVAARKLREADEAEFAPRHAAILVDGPRGAGKSTFLLSLKKLIQDDQRAHPQAPRIRVLPLLDPTMIEGSEAFLSTITANILRELESHVETSRGRRSVERHDQTELTRDLDALIEGFPALQGRRAPPSADVAPAVLADRLLRTARGGLGLERSFAQFLRTATHTLGVDLLIQPLDDVDVAFEQGWEVLETVRKYLSNGRILPVVSGDLGLFDLVVQEQFLSKATRLLDQEKQHTDRAGVEERVRELGYQYLLKILRPDRRVKLSDFRRKLLVENDWAIAADPEPVRIRELVAKVDEAMFGPFGRTNPNEIARSSYLIAQNPRAARDGLLALLELAAPLKAAEPPRKPENVIRRLADSWSHARRLTGFGLEILDDIAVGRFGSLRVWITKSLQTVPNLSALDPRAITEVPNLEEWRSIVTLVAMALSTRWATAPGEVLVFAASVSMPIALRGRDAGDRPASEPPSRVAVWTAVPSVRNDSPTWNGWLLRLPKRPKEEQRSRIKTWITRNNEQETYSKDIYGLDGWAKQHGESMWVLRMFLGQVRRSQTTYAVLSPVKMLALVGELAAMLHRLPPPEPQERDREADQRQVVNQILRSVVPVRSDPTPDGEDEQPEPDGTDDNEVFVSSTNITKLITNSIIDYQSDVRVSPWVVDRFSYRFIENLQEITDEVGYGTSVAVVFQRWMLVMLNAALVAELQAHGRPAEERNLLRWPHQGDALTVNMNHLNESKGTSDDDIPSTEYPISRAIRTSALFKQLVGDTRKNQPEDPEIFKKLDLLYPVPPKPYSAAAPTTNPVDKPTRGSRKTQPTDN
jgi:energy-coupling factor transporter ATP-binding protein EcfA2